MPCTARTAALQRVIRHDEEVAPLIDGRDVLMVIRIGPRFTAELLQGKATQLQVILDGRNSNTAQIALTYVSQIVERFNEAWLARQGSKPPPTQLVVRAWFNANLESRWFFIPGVVGLLTLVVSMMTTAMSVAREREQGTFDQLLVTPLRPFEILVGKALPGLVIGLFEATLVVLLAVGWFGIPLRGDLVTLYTGITLFILAAIGVGLMISSFAVTLQQALLGAFLFLTPAVILSGFATPIANMPPLMQQLTLVNPMRYFIIILRGVFLEATPFRLLIPEFVALALIALASLTLAATLFRHRMY
jgi:ABC-2 type transport system permease protein